HHAADHPGGDADERVCRSQKLGRLDRWADGCPPLSHAIVPLDEELRVVGFEDLAPAPRVPPTKPFYVLADPRAMLEQGLHGHGEIVGAAGPLHRRGVAVA